MPQWLLKFLFLYILQSLESRWFSWVGQVRDHQLTVRTPHLYKETTSKNTCRANIGYYRQWTMPAYIHIQSQKLLKIFIEPSLIRIQVLNSSSNSIHCTKQSSITKTEWGNQCHKYYWNGWAKNWSNTVWWVDCASSIMCIKTNSMHYSFLVYWTEIPLRIPGEPGRNGTPLKFHSFQARWQSS